MDSSANGRPNPNVSRRSFVRGAAAIGAGLALSRPILADSAVPVAAAGGGGSDVNVAIVGVGRQGKILLDLALKIPGVRFKAVCDIWSYSQRIGQGLCKAAGQEINLYDDYQQMLAEAKDIDAVIVATPDFSHAEITNACLKAGKHVYCEKEMSNDLEKARSMVLAARETGKLLQIGHQRRSNPYYKHAYQLMHKDGFCGVVRTTYGQWNQLKPLRPLPAKLVEKYSIAPDVLNKWGYNSMAEFYEWRWFKKYAGGPMTDLGSHQMDVFNWFLQSTPSSVIAVGGNESALAEATAQNVGFTPESFDHTLCTFEWQTRDNGPVRGTYVVNLTSSYNGFYEAFMGKSGTMVTAEIKEKSAMFKEQTASSLAWEDDAEKFAAADGTQVMHFDPLKSRKAKGQMDAEGMKIAEEMNKPAHQPHLENFFSAVRGAEKLNCPPEIGYETAVTVLKANEAALTGKRVEFKPEDFKV